MSFFQQELKGMIPPHTLDLIISNGDFISDVTNLSLLRKRDHSVIICNCKIAFETPSRLPKFRFEKGDYDGLRYDVDYNLNNVVVPNQLEINSNFLSVYLFRLSIFVVIL